MKAMLVFFLTSSKLTKFRSDQKRNFDPDHVKGHTRRTAINVSNFLFFKIINKLNILGNL